MSPSTTSSTATRRGSSSRKHVRGGRDERSEAVERSLRAHLLRDADAGVRDEDREKERVLHVAERERQHSGREQDQVEHREDVRDDDALVRAARLRRGGRARGELSLGLLLRQSGGRDGRRHGLSVAALRAEAPGAVEAGAVPAAERLDLHAGAGVRCVDEAAVADVDADVAEAVEEDEVAGPKRRAADAAAAVELGVARVGEREAEVRVDVADEAGAVEAERGELPP